MTISEELVAFRQQTVGCHIVAFSDMSTGMVLATSTAEKVTQEKLDTLCQVGHDALGLGQSDDIQQLLGGPQFEGPEFAVVATQKSIECFIRAHIPAQEALCFVVSEETPLDEAFANARILLKRVVGES